MSKANPTDRRYSKEHEWIFDNADGTAALGITDHAQELLTDIVYVELPEIGRDVSPGATIAVVESVKSISDIFCPIEGQVIEVNTKLETAPDLINGDAFGEGWIARLKVKNGSDMSLLMSAAEYEDMIAADKH